MKSAFSIVLFFILGTAAAQNVSLAIMPGLSNYAGDLQKASYTFNASDFCGGMAFLYNEGHFNLRAGLFLGAVEASDSATSSFPKRNLSFQTNILEGSLMLQYDILNLNNENKFTPYIMAGIGVFAFNPYTMDTFGAKWYLQPLGTEGQGLANFPGRKPYKLSQICIPAGIGIKYKISESFTAGIEFSSRLIYSDYLDDVSTKYPNLNLLEQERGPKARELSFRGVEIDPNATITTRSTRGNPNNRDNYYSSSLIITYRLFPSKNNSNFNTGADGKRSKKSGFMNCPKKVS